MTPHLEPLRCETDAPDGLEVVHDDPAGWLYLRVDVDAVLADIRAVLADVPDEAGMIEHNPDEGMRAFCCGGDVNRTYATGGGWNYTLRHASDCWYVRLVQLRDDLAQGED